MNIGGGLEGGRWIEYVCCYWWDGCVERGVCGMMRWGGGGVVGSKVREVGYSETRTVRLGASRMGRRGAGWGGISFLRTVVVVCLPMIPSLVIVIVIPACTVPVGEARISGAEMRER